MATVQFGRSSTYRTDYHVDDVLAQNHAERMDNAGKRMGDWVKVASVPLALHHSELAAAQSQLDGKYIDNWLDENSAFRTW